MENKDKVETTNEKFDPTAMPTVGEEKATDAKGASFNFDIKKLMENKKMFYGVIGGVALLIILIIVICILNGGKKLVCTKTDEYSGIKETEKITLKFKGDVPSVKREITMDYTNDNDTTEEDLKKQVEEFNKTKEEKKKSGELKYDISVSQSGKKITLVYSYSSKQFAEEAKTTIDSLDDKSMEGYKKYFENSKYTCK